MSPAAAALLLVFLTGALAQHYQPQEHYQQPVEGAAFEGQPYHQPAQQGQFQLVTQVFTLPDGSVTALQVPQPVQQYPIN